MRKVIKNLFFYEYNIDLFVFLHCVEPPSRDTEKGDMDLCQ